MSENEWPGRVAGSPPACMAAGDGADARMREESGQRAVEKADGEMGVEKWEKWEKLENSGEMGEISKG